MQINKSCQRVNKMAIGRKSLATVLTIQNCDTKSYYKVQVQANKNHGICDIILCEEVTKEVTHEFNGPDGKKHSKKKTRIYLMPVRRLSEVISDFQGRQYDDPITMEHLVNVLTQVLN